MCADLRAASCSRCCTCRTPCCTALIGAEIGVLFGSPAVRELLLAPRELHGFLNGLIQITRELSLPLLDLLIPRAGELLRGLLHLLRALLCVLRALRLA